MMLKEKRQKWMEICFNFIWRAENKLQLNDTMEILMVYSSALYSDIEYINVLFNKSKDIEHRRTNRPIGKNLYTGLMR